MGKHPILHYINEIKNKLGFGRTMTADGADVVDAVNKQADQIGNLGPYNGLDSTSTVAALSAAQGKALNDKISHCMQAILVRGGETKTLGSNFLYPPPGPTGILVLSYRAVFLISQTEYNSSLTYHSFIEPPGSAISINNRSITFGSDTNRTYWVLLPDGFTLT